MNDDLMDKVLFGDCLDLMPKIADKSIDLILCDLPYAVSKNHWDLIIDPVRMWEQYERIIKDNGAIVLTATQPFTSKLVMSNMKLFKYEWIWRKTIGSGQLNAKNQPLRVHESVLVFYKKPPTYNQQLRVGEPYHAKRKATFEGPGYNKQAPSETVNEGTRVPASVLDFSNPRIKNGHSTQKPVALMEYLIKTYTDEGQTVLDNALGSGTTAVAAVNTNRHFIGIEKDPVWYQRATDRIEEAVSQRQSTE